MVKRFLLFISFALVLSMMNGCCYIVKQGVTILKYNGRARDIGRLMKDSTLAPDLRELFNNVEEIRAFAFDSIGLKRNKNFTRFIKIDRDYIVEVLTAARADTFKQYRWWFPFAGSFPYKGFFDHKDVVKEAEKLRKKGYDVNYGRVDAFSMLGFLSDPVYSYMKSFSVYDLAELIIHEQTHATIYLRNYISFNEQAASFTGDEGGLAFVKMKFGPESEQYKTAVLENRDYDTYITLLKSLYGRLDTVYGSDLTKGEKLARKERIIAAFKDSVKVRYDALFKTGQYKGLEKARINNAYLMARMTYTENLGIFYELYKKNNYSLRLTMAQLKMLKKIKGDPEKYIREKVLGNSSGG